ncbi:MAG: glutamate--tRNA ligase, partial [Phreatobacter sp.]|nr:glutamate--tRNA ligase [Phreatobacter sp.]
PGIKERAKTVLEIIDGAGFILAKRPLRPDDKAAAILTAEARAHLASLHGRLSALPEWSAASAEAAVRAEAEVRTVKLGAIAQPLRAALTGRTTSPGIFDVLEVLGREESLARIADQAHA